MAPTIVRNGPFRLFSLTRRRGFKSTAHPEGEAKFRLTPSVRLAKNVGLSATQLRPSAGGG
jgi:hypothetical protein